MAITAHTTPMRPQEPMLGLLLWRAGQQRIQLAATCDQVLGPLERLVRLSLPVRAERVLAHVLAAGDVILGDVWTAALSRCPVHCGQLEWVTLE